jgi:cell wall-associated NlpC family hydrolase
MMSVSAKLVAALIGVCVAAAGCGSVGGGAARTAPAGDSSATAVWIPEWQMHVRDGDVVYYMDSYYSYRSGHWYAAPTGQGPWTVVTRATDPPRRESRPAPATTVRQPAELEPDRRSARVTPGAPQGLGSRVVATALKYLGAPYRWGGADARGFDCSGFVMYVYGKAGKSLPHGAVRQYRMGTRVARDELEPGDIVFFDELRHNGIYIGDGRFVHATKRGDVVKVSRLDEEWFHRRWTGARRLIISDGASRTPD